MVSLVSDRCIRCVGQDQQVIQRTLSRARRGSPRRSCQMCGVRPNMLAGPRGDWHSLMQPRRAYVRLKLGAAAHLIPWSRQHMHGGSIYLPHSGHQVNRCLLQPPSQVMPLHAARPGRCVRMPPPPINQLRHTQSSKGTSEAVCQEV